jgi:ABC-type transporter Mla maintaining outer membrane lipid asymmetry ATPase subunit MlaF
MRDFSKLLEQRKGQLIQIEDTLDDLHERIMTLQVDQKNCEQAQAIIQKVAMLTQEELKYHVSELVTLALAAVFDDPYEFVVDFQQRRNQTECDLCFQRDGEQVSPAIASGGGAVDVACFALRVALWSLKTHRTRPVLILDEPLKWLKGDDLPEKGARMIKEISARLGIQIIMISHIPDQIEHADRVFLVRKKRKKSYVTVK